MRCNFYINLNFFSQKKNSGLEDEKTGQTVINIRGTFTVRVLTVFLSTIVAKSLCNWFFTIVFFRAQGTLSHIFIYTAAHCR